MTSHWKIDAYMSGRNDNYILSIYLTKKKIRVYIISKKRFESKSKSIAERVCVLHNIAALS